MSRAPFVKWIFGALLLSFTLYWVFRLSYATRHADVNSSRTSSTNLATLIEEKIIKGFLAVEAQQNHLDQTVWAQEMLAQRHEAVFVKLWDRLRTEPNPFSVLGMFPFGQLLLGADVESGISDHRIITRSFGSPVRQIAPEVWRQLVEKWRQEGFQLEQSEWRHPRFSTSATGVATSVIAMPLHILNPEKEERCIVRGNLRIAWRQNTGTDDEPFPELIDATEIKVLSRQGETPFHHVIAAEITPEKNDRFLEPNLQLYDLDGDGLSEIILARMNRVFWNKAQGVFKPDLLLQHPLPLLNTGLIADFDGDGVADFLGVDPLGLALFHGNPEGRFPTPAKRIRFSNHPLVNPFVMTAGDIDNDGDLDVWLAQYKVPYQDGQMPTPYYDANDGHPAFLLVNDGSGNFEDRTEQAGLAAKRFRRTYSNSFVDLDNDGDLDLLVVSDFAGADVYLNNGSGHFEDVTTGMLGESHAFGMAHTFGDYDLDGTLDFLVIGMNSFTGSRMNDFDAGPAEFAEYHRMRSKMAHGNRLYFKRGARFQQTPMSDQISRSGWSWGVTTGDFDNDGDEDVYVVNGHISGQSTEDYEKHFWRHDIYLGTSKEDPVLDRYFRSVQTKHHGMGQSYGGFEKNRLFLNQSGKSFLEAGYLMGVAMEEDCRNAVSDDLDGDGKLDLLVTTFQVWPQTRQVLHLFPNFTGTAGNWIGIRLRESGPGFSPVGAKVLLTTKSGTQARHLVTGDSYRSQHATTAHFGLGKATEVERVDIVWPNGRRKSISRPAINQYHSVTPNGAH